MSYLELDHAENKVDSGSERVDVAGIRGRMRSVVFDQFATTLTPGDFLVNTADGFRKEGISIPDDHLLYLQQILVNTRKYLGEETDDIAKKVRDSLSAQFSFEDPYFLKVMMGNELMLTIEDMIRSQQGRDEKLKEDSIVLRDDERIAIPTWLKKEIMGRGLKLRKITEENKCSFYASDDKGRLFAEKAASLYSDPLFPFYLAAKKYPPAVIFLSSKEPGFGLARNDCNLAVVGCKTSLVKVVLDGIAGIRSGMDVLKKEYWKWSFPEIITGFIHETRHLDQDQLPKLLSEIDANYASWMIVDKFLPKMNRDKLVDIDRFYYFTLGIVIEIINSMIDRNNPERCLTADPTIAILARQNDTNMSD